MICNRDNQINQYTMEAIEILEYLQIWFASKNYSSAIRRYREPYQNIIGEERRVMLKNMKITPLLVQGKNFLAEYL